MEVNDDLHLGSAPIPAQAANANPTLNAGVGPMGRVAFLNIVPLTKQAANAAALQHMTNGTSLTLTAGTGATSVSAPDGSGRTCIKFDCNRCVSLTSTANLSAITFTVTGFDSFGRLQTNSMAGPNNNTVNSTKAFLFVLSIVPNATDGVNNVSAGMADKFGLPWAIYDAGYIMPKWNNTLAQDAGTFVAGDSTDPATASTTDPRGTYAPSSAADGVKRLVCWLHLTAAQCGPNATLAGALGVTPV